MRTEVGGPIGPTHLAASTSMQHLPLPSLKSRDDGLVDPYLVPGPTDPCWAAYDGAFADGVSRLITEFDESLAPNALSPAAVGAAEATLALGLICRGLSDIADERRECILALVRRAIECYVHDRLPTAGRITSLRIVDTESHHGARRPMVIDTERDGRWVLKDRPAAGEAEVLGDDGLFALLNELGEGTVDLPRLDVEPSGEEPELSWQRFVEPPADCIAVGDGVEVATTAGSSADRTWRGIGHLAGASAALGLTDLGEENVLTRARGGMVELIPIDTELILHPGLGLHRTMLTRDSRTFPNHHTGIEAEPRACSGSGPIMHLGDAGVLKQRTRPCRRSSSRSLIATSTGHVGYSQSVTAFLHGIVESWVVVAKNRAPVAAHLKGRVTQIRALARPTAEYTNALAAWLTGEVEDPCHALAGEPPSPWEAMQLRRGDVPYLVRTIDDSAIEQWKDGLTLGALGPVLRDAAEYVRDQLPPLVIDVPSGVFLYLEPETRRGAAAVDLPGSDRRAVFSWDDHRVRLSLPQSGQTAPRDDVRERLLRVRAVDAPLRNRWAATQFTDADLAARLDKLTTAALDWLEDVAGEHGWPGTDMVGVEAAGAAAQLLQHVTDPQRQAKLIGLMIDAAMRGQATWTDVAGAIDSQAVLTQTPQAFGTKFQRNSEGSLEPYPLADPDRIDAVRANLGLEPLPDYLTRLERHFNAPQRSETVNL